MAKWSAVLAFLLFATTLSPAAIQAAETDLKWLQRLAEQGDAEAWYRIGVIKEQGIGMQADPRGAVRAFTKAAELGHAKAQFRLAQLLAAGIGGVLDLGGARYWYGEAAKQGIAAAAYNAGLFAETGIGGPVDMAAAEAFYRGASAGGIAAAAERLGLLHLDGRLGGAPDPVTALAWLMKAAALGSEASAALARDLAKQMTKEQLAAARAMAETL
ncbi:MAG TPA: tetratricopeptide repeat protein [Kiloniellales bacterium]|nr:tetratricopeptide repeat protein [Kiloniellales bacterium]